jgi:hypothetical protein
VKRTVRLECEVGVCLQNLGEVNAEVERPSGVSTGAPEEVMPLGGTRELASVDEIAGINNKLAIAEADQSAVCHFAKNFYSQSKILSHYLVYIRVHSSTSLVEIRLLRATFNRDAPCQPKVA